MGHPYNQTQQIEIKNLSAQRFVGTDIQKNLFYGRDIPVLRYEYTFEQHNIRYDVSSYKYDFLTSGDFVQLYLDQYNLKAEPKFIIQGEVIDYPDLVATWSGMERGAPVDKPLVAPTISGKHEYIDWDQNEKRFLYTQSYVVRIDYDRPFNRGYLPASGNIKGLIPDIQTMGYFFYTGSYHGNNYVPPHVPVEYASTIATGHVGVQFFFYTGRYDGPQT